MPRQVDLSSDAEPLEDLRRRSSRDRAEGPRRAWLDNPEHLRSFFEAVDRARHAKASPPSEKNTLPLRR